jgi:hypothetical protein
LNPGFVNNVHQRHLRERAEVVKRLRLLNPMILSECATNVVKSKWLLSFTQNANHNSGNKKPNDVIVGFLTAFSPIISSMFSSEALA